MPSFFSVPIFYRGFFHIKKGLIMSRQIQIRRGTAAENDAFTGAIGEVTMDTTNNTLRVHDGTTVGGTILAKKSEIPEQQTLPNNYDFVIETQLPTSSNNYTWYRKYKSGWIEQGGIAANSSSEGNVTLPVTMADTNYAVTATNEATSSENAWGWVYMKSNSKTTTGFGLCSRQGTGNAVYLRARWSVSGMAAQQP